MELGTLLVVLAIVLAVVSYFVGDRTYNGRSGAGSLLTVAVIVGFVGVLLGVGDLTT